MGTLSNHPDYDVYEGHKDWQFACSQPQKYQSNTGFAKVQLQADTSFRTLKVMMQGFSRLDGRIIELDQSVTHDRAAGALAALDLVLSTVSASIGAGAKVDKNLPALAEKTRAHWMQALRK